MNATARVVATAWLLAGLSACGGDDIVTSGPTDVTANVVQDTAAITEPIDAGTSFLQETISSSGDGLVVDIAATGEDGSVPPDGGLFGPDVSNDCPGGAGCACKDHGQCDTAICIEVAGQKKCAQKCVDTCPKGFQCVPAGSGDVIHICAPLLNWL